MKTFKAPTMTVIHLSQADVVTTSTCYGYYCDECAECSNAYDCGVFDCYGYKGK